MANDIRGRLGPKFSWICITVERKLQKKPQPGKLTQLSKAKTLIERVGTRYLKQVPWSPQQTISDHRLYLSGPQIGALITSADHSWPQPLSFHTALKIAQPNIFTLYQHGSSSQTRSLTWTNTHTHSHRQTHTHTHSSAEHILALLTWLTITNKLTHIDKQHTHTHTHTLTHSHSRTQEYV